MGGNIPNCLLLKHYKIKIMLDDLIIETEPIDRTNLSNEEKVIIDCIEETEMINFDLTRNDIDFIHKDSWLINCWELKNDEFYYNYRKIYKILGEKYQYNYEQINDLVKDILLKHYKIKVTTTDVD